MKTLFNLSFVAAFVSIVAAVAFKIFKWHPYSVYPVSLLRFAIVVTFFSILVLLRIYLPAKEE